MRSGGTGSSIQVGCSGASARTISTFLVLQTAVTCLVNGSGCGGYTLRGGASPAFRGLMTWSINWDRYYNWAFMNAQEPFLNALP